MSEDSGSDSYDTGSEATKPLDFFVTRRKKEKMVKDDASEAEAAILRGELAAKMAEIEKLQKQLARASSSGESSSSREQHVEMRRPDFRELRELVTKFDPKQATCLSAEEWVAEIEDTAAHYGWDGPTRLHCARLNLEGSAKLWWSAVQRETTTWTLFTEKLVKAYPSSRDAIFYHAEMTKRSKTRDETIEEYVYSQVALGKRAGFNESVIVKYIIAGLGDFLSKSKVQLGGKIESIEELISQLKWMEGLKDTKTETVPVRVTEKKQEKVALCYRCGQPGHRAAICSTGGERTCYNCGVSGHLARIVLSRRHQKPDHLECRPWTKPTPLYGK
ncbi:hypothetical protein ZHAS_00006856 [Anopheles sinensis]|uniref:CCHC-type domain-containing protein n=1 Tax=Anopheles sinensis TaxID=74873 RepID=A0A084VNH1_ANOSI|nr:hypothetical protein ZHAS_00006856 [Anopheles sinensis]